MGQGRSPEDFAVSADIVMLCIFALCVVGLIVWAFS